MLAAIGSVAQEKNIIGGRSHLRTQVIERIEYDPVQANPATQPSITAPTQYHGTAFPPFRLSNQGQEQELKKREIDQKAAIMIVIEHFGDIQPGTKCSAVFFDRERIRREKEFYAKLYSENGVHDPEILRAMVAANVPDDPYWLVSLKSGNGATVETTRLHRVDDRTGKIIPDPK